MEEIEIQHKIAQLKCCVIIPTYNNCNTLQRVIDGVSKYTSSIIIVNDGSTDNTSKILENYSEIEQLHIPKNKGKGNALRLGFKQAVKLGYDFAISIDSDGQHFPEDIPNFIKTLEASNTKDVLLIGARNMAQEGVPKKSSFGNKFSNFWFWFETGIKLQDTQSGFRLYPLHILKQLNFYTTKFEFEIEVIVKAAWKDVVVKNIPIKVLYDESERVSHFRPFKDFTRISILNTWLVIVTIFYIAPRNAFRRLKKKGIKRFFKEDFLGSNDSPKKKALSIAVGVFIGLSPFWGFHTFLILFLAVTFRLNKVIAFAASNVSLPPFIPFVVLAGIKTGSIILNEPQPIFSGNFLENFEMLTSLKVYVIGSLVFAVIGAVSTGILSYICLSVFQRKKIAPHNG